MQSAVELRTLLGRFRRRWFALVAARTIARGATAAAIPIFGALAVNWLLAPEGGPLLALALVTALAVAALAAVIASRMQRRPSDRQVARFVEERAPVHPDRPALDDALVSAVDAAESAEPGSGFRPLIVEGGVRALRDIAPAEIVPASSLRTAALAACGGLFVLALALTLAAPPLASVLETARLTFFPSSVHVDVQPGDARIVAGQPLRIRAAIRAGGRELTRFTPSLTVSAGSEQRTVPMEPDGNGFAFEFESVDRSFQYHVAAGPASSSEFSVTALFAPRVERIDLHYEYPAFTGLPPRNEEGGGDIYAPKGTRVRVRVHTDKPVTSGVLALGNAGPRRMQASEGRVLETELVLAADDSYRVQLLDADGLQSSGQTEYFIRLMDDRPPDVRILRPAGDQQITPLEEVMIEARADDDYGIARFELVFGVAGGAEKAVPLSNVTGTSVARIGSHLIAAENLNVAPGDVITYYARARDVARGKRSTEARSDIYFLEVRPFSEEFVAAQSQNMGGGSSPQIDGLIAAQKEIISATWNIERRSGAGRSAADIQAIAEAQAQLKARVEQMLRGGRGRNPFRLPQRIAAAQRTSRRGGQEPVDAAIRAMEQAIDQLQGQRTKEAIPHEMAALQQLLQLQAEVRRRQVMQQANSGSGGSGRQGQDLSALFDKELQRQQRTNYETRSQIDERPDEQTDNDALERIRDLARRQEELSRRQRELAERKLTEEELKRQLERLTREQMDLRQQAEQLAREMNQEGKSGRQGGSRSEKQQQSSQQGQQQGQQRSSEQQADASGGAGGAGDMQRASEQMGNAASELKRENAAAAAENSRKAAEELRRLEQQLRGNDPAARERAAGELRLEAQQIADAQRRIAAEAERLGRGRGAGNADALRRLADEKENLADRIESLRANAAALGGDGPAREAASEIEREKVATRMRETAAAMRSRAQQDSRGQEEASKNDAGATADAERQLARTLDDVARTLGGARAEAQQLSEQLGEARDIRERLDALERKMREAEAQAGQAGAGGESAGERRAALEKLRQEYAQELQRAQEALGRLQNVPESGLGGATPEEHEYSRSAPGNESFKQDFSEWELLRKRIDDALDEHEADVSARLAKKLAEDRLSAGGSRRVPDIYQRLIARYYESLARVKK